MRQAFRNAFQNGLNRSPLNPAMPHQYPNMGENLKDIGQSVSSHLKKNYNPKDPLFRKSEEGRTVNNLWSGYELGGKGKIAVTASVLGGGAIIASNPRNYQNFYNNGTYAQAESEMLDVESLQSTRADGLGYQAQIGAGASQALTTSGDLVFAMHKTRHSGQF